MKDYKKIIEGVIGIIKTTEKTDIGFANICSYLSDNCDELFEDGDERIKQSIIADIKSRLNHCTHTMDDYYREQIAWLEKQESVGEIVERCKTSWYNEGKIQGQIEGLSDDGKYQQGWHDALEKQGEQKSQRMISAEAKEELYDKNKPKFKVGDWIVQKNNWIVQKNIGVYKVIEICNLWYEVIDSEDNHYKISYDKECMCHLWTIKDAKDGDVLAAPDGGIFIYADSTGDYAQFYVALGRHGDLYIPEDTGNWEEKNCIYPATKEQRELLFQKMREAGYEWDAERKELKQMKGGEE